jgi:hypothetical protein
LLAERQVRRPRSALNRLLGRTAGMRARPAFALPSRVSATAAMAA